MTGKAIFACANPTGAHWQLGPLPPAGGEVMLLGWNLATKPVDSGIPEEVGAVLANALTSIARVSFPVSETPHGALETWGNSDDDQVRSLGSVSLIERAEAMLQHWPSRITLLSTRCQETAKKSFEDPCYPWHLQGQVLLLSSLHTVPPDIDRQTLLSLISDDWAKHVHHLRSVGVRGVLRPGVDGDIVGILSLTGEFKRALLEALAY